MTSNLDRWIYLLDPSKNKPTLVYSDQLFSVLDAIKNYIDCKSNSCISKPHITMGRGPQCPGCGGDSKKCGHSRSHRGGSR